MASLLSKNFHTSASTPFIYDGLGRATIFHGTNFVVKKDPWYPEVLQSAAHINQLKENGFNAVRLGFIWSAAEPAEGQFNTTYYKIMGDIVDSLASAGVSVILDIHQDVLSSRFCLYDAFPNWALDKTPPSPHAFPWPLQPDGDNICPYDRSWSKNYFAEATGIAFQSLYQNQGGLRDAFAEFWKYTAGYFKSKPLIGYEIINEPWAGDIYADPTLLLPGQAGSKNLLPFYDAISEAIRSVDTGHIVLYEPVTWGMIFNGQVLGTGFTDVPGGKDSWAEGSVLAFHYYCWWLDSNNEMTKKTCDRAFGPKVFAEIDRDLRQTAGAALLTEWGQGCADNFYKLDARNSSSFAECTAVMDLADKHLVGWTDWYVGGKLQESRWAPNPDGWEIFSRPYAQKIAGRPVKMHFDTSSAVFTLCLAVDPRLGPAQTEIYANFKTTYAAGADVQVTAGLEVVSVDSTKNLITVRATKNGMEDTAAAGKDIVSCVTVKPK